MVIFIRRDIPGTEYIIVGKTEDYGYCLVCLAGRSEEKAKERLKQMLENPDGNDKKLMGDMTDFKIEEVQSKDCWWNYGCD